MEFESNDSVIVNFLNALASQYVNSNPEEVRKYGEQALDLAEKIGYPEAMVRSYFNIGNSYYIGGDFPKSIDNYLKALEILEELDDEQGIANALMGIGNVQGIQGFPGISLNIQIANIPSITTGINHFFMCLKF